MSTPARYLFERLSDTRAAAPPDPLAAIRDNVQRIVASARGPLDGEAGMFGFGLTSPVALGRDNAVQRAAYLQELAVLIARWERRLKNVVIEVEPMGGMDGPLRFTLRAQLALEPAADEVRFPLEVA